jgi:hypothetical protein
MYRYAKQQVFCQKSKNECGDYGESTTGCTVDLSTEALDFRMRFVTNKVKKCDSYLLINHAGFLKSPGLDLLQGGGL